MATKSAKVGRYTYTLSKVSGKKLATVVDGKTVNFGAAGYEHYHDRTGLLPKSLNHGDSERRRRYKTRHQRDHIDDPTKPGYHAWRVLW